MKIYEKPMVMVERINVEDVITSSVEDTVLSNPNAAAGTQLQAAAGTTGAIVFEW